MRESGFIIGKNMKIIEFEDKYRDDLIFMIMEAKNALGRVPGLNEDLLDITANYFAKGDKFWIAVDDNDRVVGSIGFNIAQNKTQAVLHRLFVKYNLKRQGIGTALLQLAENYLVCHGVNTVFVNLGKGKEWFESRYFYVKNNYIEYKEDKMKKTLTF